MLAAGYGDSRAAGDSSAVARRAAARPATDRRYLTELGEMLVQQGLLRFGDAVKTLPTPGGGLTERMPTARPAARSATPAVGRSQDRPTANTPLLTRSTRMFVLRALAGLGGAVAQRDGEQSVGERERDEHGRVGRLWQVVR